MTLEAEVRECERDLKTACTGSEDGGGGHEPGNAGRRPPEAGKRLTVDF